MTFRSVAIVGATSTGKTWLKDALISVLSQRGDAASERPWAISDNTALMTAVDKHMLLTDERLAAVAKAHHALFDITLVMGLDLLQSTTELQSNDHALRPKVDTLLREILDHYGLAYKVIYGHEHQRLNNALLALGLAGEDDLARQIREQGQFAINQGRSQWQCNECSDPACEHKLFTSLLEKRSAG